MVSREQNTLSSVSYDSIVRLFFRLEARRIRIWIRTVKPRLAVNCVTSLVALMKFFDNPIAALKAT